jgi:tetratricopeptide (TPR) repeat protein
LIAIFLWPAPLSTILADWKDKAVEAFENGELEEARRRAESALADPATAAVAHELLGRIALRERRNQEAISHFEAASARGHLTPNIEKGWVTALLNLGRQEEACALMERALSRDPSQVTFRYQLGGAYLAQGNAHEALPHLEKAYQQGLRHAGVLMLLARARLLTGQEDRAVELLESFAQIASSRELLWEMGKLLFERLLYKEALVPLQKAWEGKPGSYEVGMYLALCHYLVEQYRESEQVLTAIQAGSAPPLDYRILLGSVYARLGRKDEASRELEKAIKYNPDRADGYLNLGLFYLEQKDFQRAMELLDAHSPMRVKGAKLLYMIPARRSCDGLAPPQFINSQNRARGEAYSQLARVLHSKEQKGSALEVYLLALEADNRSPSAYAGIGKSCWELNSFRVAQSFLLQGLELNPSAAELHFNLGLVFQSLGLTEEAIRSYQNAIKLELPNVRALHWVQLGIAQLAVATSNDAQLSFEKALDCDPKFAQAYYELGKVYFQRKEFERAEQFLEKAVRLDPMLSSAYYQYGLACLRNGKQEKGKMLLETFSRKRVLH